VLTQLVLQSRRIEKMKVYLAGPIFQSEDHECIDWRKDAKCKLNGHQILDPMERDYRGVTNENFTKIVEEDKGFIDNSNILLVNFSKPSVGTSMEILYAWEREKHIVIISESTDISPWLLYHSNKICRSLSEAIDYIQKL
jgi:nucleoside 2-deoxyribosyltransferase